MEEFNAWEDRIFNMRDVVDDACRKGEKVASVMCGFMTIIGFAVTLLFNVALGALIVFFSLILYGIFIFWSAKQLEATIETGKMLALIKLVSVSNKNDKIE